MSARVSRFQTRFSPKLELAFTLFEAAVKSGKPYTIKGILRKAGYSETSVQQSHKVMKHIRPKLADIIKGLEDHRQKVMERMEKTVNKAKYPDLVRSLEVTTKSIALLGGKPTDIIKISKEDRDRLDALLDGNTDEGTT